MRQLFLFFAFLLPFCINAQLHESFDNVEISYKYPWKGDVDRFKTEDAFLKLEARAQPDKATVYLYGATLTDNEWNFRVKSGYRTTVDNCMRVYLWSNKTDLNDHPTAYFVEIGGEKRGGDKQIISLCYVEEWGAKEVLLSKTVEELNNPFDIHIRLVSDGGRITLYYRPDTIPEFTEVGTEPYLPQLASGYFMLYCKYSSNHAKNKYFGPVDIKNFTVANPPEVGNKPDEQIELSLTSFKQEDASTILLSFNQPVNPEFASFVLTSLGEVDEVYWSDDEKQIRLVWYGIMEKGKSYTLTYENLYGVNLKPYNLSLPPFIATVETENKPVIPLYAMGDVLINEVMANPKGVKGLPETEYVELHNTTDKDIDLTGWSFYYAAKATILKSIIPAKGYAILFRDGRDITVDKGGVSIPLAAFPSALANTGKQLQLRSNENTLMDDIAYPEAKPGYSWERTGDDWLCSADKRGGTPGSKNSSEDYNADDDDDGEMVIVDPREIVFSELLPEPQIGGSEYIELYNRSDKVLPLTGLAIAVRKADGSLSTNYSLNSVVEPLDAGEYRVLTKSIDGVLDFFVVPSPEKINEVKLPVLANTSSKLVLFRSQDKEVIDEVHYSEKWHSSSVKNKKGIALERIDLDGDSQNPANWTSASSLSGGGTPGYANSQKEENGGATGIQEPEFVTATGNYEIAYRLDRPGYICRASIYDTSGRRIAEIANLELLGTEGVFSWNGFATGGNKPSTGVYIFHAELHHPQGGRKAYKKVFLVR